MEILYAQIEAWRGRLDSLAAELTASERERVERIGPSAGRERAIVARALLRRELVRRGGGPVGELVLGPHGKPRLPGGAPPHFNASHAGSLVALAFDDALDVGIDVEPLRPVPRALGMARRFGDDAVAELAAVREGRPRDRAFLCRWTAHEALGKALGDGVGHDPLDARAREATVRPLEGLPSGYVGAVAALGPCAATTPRRLLPE